MARPIVDEMRDPNTPDDVILRSEAREPVTDPTLGIPVNVDRQGTPRHRLVTIGDSLTHGFQSGAIFNTDLSYPAIIAWEMGWDNSFRHPAPYGGWGGLPLNLEYLSRRLEREFGDQIDWWELSAAVFSIRQFMDDVEDYWERGRGSVIPNRKGINHNLAVYGWKLLDIISRNADTCLAAIQEPKDDLVRQLVENANERAALWVLNSARNENAQALTPIEAAAALGAEGTLEQGQGDGIETLIILIGANNALGSVIELRVAWSGDSSDTNGGNNFTVWRPTHFKAELDQVVAQVKQIRARHVIWGTVPHVTIAPIARGVGSKVAPGSRYFPYYTYPWINDKDFDPKDDPNITEQQARAIDSAIDQYNDDITDVVKQARQEGRDWYVFETAGLLDRLAARRYIEDPKSRPDWWTQYELPPALQMLTPVPDSRFFLSNRRGRTSGGLFSLDGIHPTTIGYGLMAQELIDIMQRAGVKFYLGDGKSERLGPVRVDFKRLIGLDTLISDPPRSFGGHLQWLGWLDQNLGIFKRLLKFGN
ncbi:MAG TPA: hypothetical protein DDZ80_18740 [Cyanobacteria bacterium UBA8803]|nr:hypothetical protein [Cyanobacteria bacterium UBA9273]HBL60415.1 hypothetical protein [Cyanobacteria bacterium UBA8803]